ncbi:RNB family domain-containing protein [Besnoitia besnoiti]|uniref:RNB family domain-containing protein n=1 Tax=Besnoitia besnoiti TaxID=94643 RepID=A0A2A9M6A7_BESBE|nr:RNB family domain-containing protein [Besnoitia besnoiti]PFH31183.1 RNB family domain-containing protein [Besnoitia besnoiti]
MAGSRSPSLPSLEAPGVSRATSPSGEASSFLPVPGAQEKSPSQRPSPRHRPHLPVAPAAPAVLVYNPERGILERRAHSAWEAKHASLPVPARRRISDSRLHSARGVSASMVPPDADIVSRVVSAAPSAANSPRRRHTDETATPGHAAARAQEPKYRVTVAGRPTSSLPANGYGSPPHGPPHVAPDATLSSSPPSPPDVSAYNGYQPRARLPQLACDPGHSPHVPQPFDDSPPFPAAFLPPTPTGAPHAWRPPDAGGTRVSPPPFPISPQKLARAEQERAERLRGAAPGPAEDGRTLACPFCRRQIPFEVLHKFVRGHAQLYFQEHACGAPPPAAYDLRSDSLPGRLPPPAGSGISRGATWHSGPEPYGSATELLDAFRRRQGKVWGPVPPSFFTSPYNTQYWFFV